jgi:hypothetical protein
MGITLFLWFWTGFARAQMLELPNSLEQEVLSESTPTAYAPTELSVADYDLVWDGPSPSGVDVRLGEQSLEWVRVLNVLAVARARILIRVTNGSTGGAAVSDGHFTPFAPHSDGTLTAEIPIALLSTPSNVVEVQLTRGGTTTRHRIGVRLHRKMVPAEAPVYFDPSCSKYFLEVTAHELKGDAPNAANLANGRELIEVGCRYVYAKGDEHRVSQLELLIFWDGTPNVEVAHAKVPEVLHSLWIARVTNPPGKIILENGSRKVELSYRIAKNANYGAVGLGAGPYAYAFESPSGLLRTVAPVFNVYGSYYFTDAVRFVAFSQTAVAANPSSDTGLYASIFSFQAIDKRVTMRLLPGFLTQAFLADGLLYYIFSFPQGTEFRITDFLKPRHDLFVGFFLYPLASGRSYYNGWIRWGTPKLFLEFNYLAWQVTVEEKVFRSQSVGFSVGIPFFWIFVM